MAESRATAREQELCETLRLEIEAYSHAINGFDAETAAVEQGTHPEFVRRCRVIEAAKDERQRTARQFYARQLATVDSLAARELEAAQLQFEEAIKRARAKQQMKEDKQRLKEDKANGPLPRRRSRWRLLRW
ncbi:hypothetical protein M885DRAFT_191800 [Pelagophyceae sp. CCMP2097]|nr:hypothetical protein M885DRAFT_191800 [Pelagophyceae sp. CCMP2097]